MTGPAAVVHDLLTRGQSLQTIPDILHSSPATAGDGSIVLFLNQLFNVTCKLQECLNLCGVMNVMQNCGGSSNMSCVLSRDAANNDPNFLKTLGENEPLTSVLSLLKKKS